MKRNKKLMIAAIATLVVAGSLASAGAVYAATSVNQGAFLSRVAQILGISDQKLTSALKEASVEKVDQLLKDGKITQSQADQMKQRIQNGQFVGFGGMGMGMEKGERFDFMGSLIQYLGMNQSDMKSAIGGGKSLTDIITSKGKTVSDAKTYLTDQAKIYINQQVKDGKITQDNANTFVNNLPTTLDNFLNGKLGRPHGGKMGMLPLQHIE